jgi:hypothetical protein
LRLVDGRAVRIGFREVEDVELTQRGPEHIAACVLAPAQPRI